MDSARPHEADGDSLIERVAQQCAHGCTLDELARFADATDEPAVHAHLAREIAGRLDDPDLGERHRVWHLLGAGDVDAAIGVIEGQVAANESAGRFEEALVDLDVALSVGALLSGAQHAALIARSAYAATMCERHDSIFRWQVALADANGIEDVDGEARARYFLHWLGDESLGTALDHLREAAPLAETGSGWALDCRALLAAFEGDIDGARRDAGAALAAARRDGDRRLELDALNALAYVQHWAGDLDRAVSTQESAARLAEAVHDHRAGGIARLNLALYQFERLDVDDAIQTAVACATALEARGVAAYASFAWCTAGLLTCMSGRPSDALDLLPDSVLAADDGATAGGLVPGYRTLLSAVVLTARGDDDVVETAISRAEQAAEQSEDGLMQSLALACRTRRAAHLGDVGQVLDAAARFDASEPLAALICASLFARLGVLMEQPTLIEHASRLLVDLEQRDSRLARLVRDEVRSIAAEGSADMRELEAISRRWRAAGMAGDAAMCEATALVLERTSSGRSVDRRLLEVHHELVRAGAVADAELVARYCAPANHADAAVDGGPADAPVFAALDADQRRGLDRSATPRQLARGQLVRDGDDPVRSVWVVRSGSIRLFRDGPDGRQLTIDVVGPGGLIDEEALLDGAARGDMLAEAREETILWGVPLDILSVLMRRAPDLAVAIGAAVAQRARHARELAEEVAFWPVERRVLRLLCRLDDQFGHPSLGGGRMLSKVFTQEDLAIMVGAGRPSVSLIINDLKRRGLVDIRKRRLVLLDREELERRQCHPAA